MIYGVFNPNFLYCKSNIGFIGFGSSLVFLPISLAVYCPIYGYCPGSFTANGAIKLLWEYVAGVPKEADAISQLFLQE